MEALNLHPDSTALRSSFKKTFALHIYQQVSGGYRRISANKHDVEAYVNVARTYGMIGDNFRAMEILTQGTLENPESVPLWMLIGYLELQEKREAEALSVFREIIRLDNKNGRAHHSAADLLVRAKDGRLHDLPSALHHAELACVLEPNNAEFIDTLAEVRFQMGNKREALALIQQAISLAPNDDSFKAQRARFEAK